jgi:hypothetical protein
MVSITHILKSGIFCALIFGSANVAFANESVRKLGDFGAWQAYTFNEADGSKVCYMTSEPAKHVGNYSKRGKIFAQLTHRPQENQRDTFSYVAGYTYKPQSAVNVMVDTQNYNLFTHNDTGWASDQDTDKRIAQSLRRGARMVVKGTSGRGTPTEDTFTLSGANAAYNAISTECGINE